MHSLQTDRSSATNNGEKFAVTIIGAGTILPAQGRSPSCHLLRHGSQNVIFDLGPGSIGRLGLAGMDYREIETVFISHLHPDHTLDIVTLLHSLNATPGWVRTKPLTIAGCYGLKVFIERLLEIYRDAVPESYSLKVLELTVGRHEVAGLTVETCLTGHTSNSLAFRIEMSNGTFVYSGDAVDRITMVQIARQADVFVCECSFENGTQTDDHLTPEGAAYIAQAAGVGQLVLTHVYPHVDLTLVCTQAAGHFSGPVIVATDGTVVSC
jgi:ribonuclease Z